MSADPGLAIFKNPLIFGNILSFLGKDDLMNVRSVSKAFDAECVRLISKRGYGRWVHGQDYFEDEDFQEIVKESRHPKLLIGKIKMIGKPDLDFKFVQSIISNADHIIRLDLTYITYKDAAPILNACSDLIELRCMFYLNEQPDECNMEWISKLPLNLKHLSRLELVIDAKGSESSVKVSAAAAFIKNIITSSDRLTMLSIQILRGGRFSWFLKKEDSYLTKKLIALNTLHANSEENHDELRNLLSLVKTSIENLFLHMIWSQSFTEWPVMPKLTTISLSNGYGIWDVRTINHVPNKTQAPKLKLMLLGGPYGMWREEEYSWTNEFKLYKDINIIDQSLTRKEENERHLTAVIIRLPLEFQNYWLDDGTKFLTDLNVVRLFINMNSQNWNHSGGCLLKWVHNVPSLKYIFVRTSHEEDVKIMEINVNT